MNLEYSIHAREMMKLRGISEAEVEACLQDHDILYTDKKGNPKYNTHVGERYIKVVVAKDDSSFVITVED
jgi:phage antirepressor YoqD-like protein